MGLTCTCVLITETQNMLECGREARAWLQTVGGLWAVWALVNLRPADGYNLSPAHSRRMNGPPDSLFGFSVALWSDENGIKRAVVGAPRGRNSTTGWGELSLGNIFFCEVDGAVVCRPDTILPTVSKGDYSEAALDVLGDPKEALQLEQVKASLGRPKNVMGFGHTLATLKHDASPLAACAPRYPRYEGSSIEVRGACFVRTSPDSEPKLLLPYSRRSPMLDTYQDAMLDTYQDAMLDTYQDAMLDTYQDAMLDTYQNAMMDTYQDAMLGFSAALDDTGSNVVMGGPTAFYGEGMVLSYPISNGPRPVNRLGSGLQEPGNADYYTSTYEGWALVLGNFDNLTHLIAVSTVNYGSYTGRVSFYPKVMTPNTEPLDAVYGEEVGGHFGYCLGTADLDGDGADDLLVGAPLAAGGEGRSLAPDAGKIYVYYAPMLKGVDKLPPTQVSGLESWGRFGAAITSLGDIDQDGYHDIAVAAPYGGMDGGGAVYVFNGGVDGLHTPHSQVIEASIFSGKMRGFGFSLDGGLDIDDNGYPDLIIGAAESDTALLIRSAPVIRLVGRVFFASDTVMAEDNSCEIEAPGYKSFKGVCFNLRVDLTYDTHTQFNDLRMQFKMVLEGPEDNSLFGFKINNDHRYTIVRSVNFIGKNSPWSVPVFFKRVRSNIGQTLSVSVTVSLVPADDDTMDDVTTVPPVLDAASATFTTNTTLLCLDNITCFSQPDLEIAASSHPVTLGEDWVVVEVQVTVKDDPGYKVEVEIRHPEELGFQRVEGEGRIPSCSHHQLVNQIANSLTCVFDFIDADELESFTLHFVYDAVQMLEYLTSSSSSTLQLTLSVTSDTEAETNTRNNHVTVSVPVLLKAVLYTKAYSVLESATVVVNQTASSEDLEKAKKDPDSSFPVNRLGPQLLHEFSLTNRGPSPVIGTKLVFQLPLYHGDQLLTYYMDQPSANPSQVTCSILPTNPFHLQSSKTRVTDVFRRSTVFHPATTSPPDNTTSPPDNTTSPPDNTTSHSTNPATAADTAVANIRLDFLPKRRRRQVLPQKPQEGGFVLTTQAFQWSSAHIAPRLQDHERSYYSKDSLTKTLACNLTSCSFSCEVRMLEAETTVSVSFSSHLITATVSEVPYRSVSIVSWMSAEVEQDNSTIINSITNAKTQVFLQRSQERRSVFDVPLWIFLVAVAVSVILILLIIAALWKAGFFKRTRPPTAPQRESKLLPSNHRVNTQLDDDRF